MKPRASIFETALYLCLDTLETKRQCFSFAGGMMRLQGTGSAVDELECLVPRAPSIAIKLHSEPKAFPLS